MTSTLEDKFLGCLIGGAAGDALGTTVEFVPYHVLESQPERRVVDMIGQGKFKLEPGMWTDDTSMMLCLCESLIEQNGRFDGIDQQQKYYQWYMNGHLSSNGVCFDIGKVTRKHLLENLENQREFHPNISDGASGNGALMRLAPVPLAYSNEVEKAIFLSGESSMTTHPSEISRDACKYYAGLILGALSGATKEELLSPLYSPPGVSRDYWERQGLRQEVLDIVQNCSYKQLSTPDISNSAYVVKTMEAALWAFYHTTSFKDGALMVVNLGDDADTAGCIYGQLAGAYYGFNNIPETWTSKIVLRELFVIYANELLRLSNSKESNFQPSITFKEIQELNKGLEEEYNKIRRKVDPGPYMYKSLQQFDQDISIFQVLMSEKVNTLQHVTHETSSALIQDFVYRLSTQDRTQVQNRTQSVPMRASLLGSLKSRNLKQ